MVPTYTPAEIDAIAVYCAENGQCYVVPIDDVAGLTYVHLRLSTAKNDQGLGIKWASKYAFGAIAQLGERPAGSREVVGSSPTSSTS